MRPKLVAVALTGGVLVLGAGSGVAASLPSWTTHHATGAMTPAARSRAVSATPSSLPSVRPSTAPSPAHTSSKAKAVSTSARNAKHHPAKHQAAKSHAKSSITYIVKPGDTLSGIAEWFSLHGYGALYAANMSVIGSNPNLIFPGEHITISDGVMKLSGTRA